MRYEPAAAEPRAKGCQPGTAALGYAIAEAYPELTCMRGAYGCYNLRRIAGTTWWSLHAEGRAVDVGVPPELAELGWTLACDIVARRRLYGTMRVMWDGHIWSLEQGADWHPLRLQSNQHRDHVHIEQYWFAAQRPRSTQDVYARALKEGR